MAAAAKAFSTHVSNGLEMIMVDGCTIEALYGRTPAVLSKHATLHRLHDDRWPRMDYGHGQYLICIAVADLAWSRREARIQSIRCVDVEGA